MCAERSTSACTSGSSSSNRNSRQLQARVFLLDDSVHTFSVNSCALGSELFFAIIEKQTILESDYFDLEFVNIEGVRCWIDHSKSIIKQVGSGKDLVFIFAVKFYTPHPNLLEEEYTRYLFALQIKRDIVSGQLICSTNTAGLLASYIVQAEIGDFLEDDYLDNNYLRPLKLVNQPNDEILNKIMDFHKTHIGLSASEADFYLLDTARKIEYYGVKMHLAKDHENLPLNLSVTHMGVVVFQNLTKINTFSWAKIRKLSFKRKKFLIKLHPEGYGYYKGMVEFYFETRDDCKRFWKKCIEHHSFFRCPASDKSNRKKPTVVTNGSSFRYCGRTQKELIEYVRENYTSKRDRFERPTKSKISKSPHNGKHPRLGKSYHPFAIKSSYSVPSRAVSDSSELNRTGFMGNATTHTPLQQRLAGGAGRPRWSHSAGHSPHENSRETKEGQEDNEVAVVKENNNSSNSIKVSSQKRSKKGRKLIQVSRTGSSADEDDDKRVTASEMSLSSGGRRESNTNGPSADEEPLPAKEAFRGTERLSRQRASIGGFGDISDSDQDVSPPKNPENPRPKPVRQISEPARPLHKKELQDPLQKIVCIDQYRSRRSRNPDSLIRPNQTLSSSKRYKSTPNDVARNSRLDSVDGLDNNELLSDIPYVLLRRHKSPEQPRGPGSIKSASQSRRSLLTKSLKSVKDTNDGGKQKKQSFGQMRQSKSLDRRLVGLDSSTRPIVVIAPKSPKLLREEYMQSQRRHVSDRATIEALKNQLRASNSVRNMGRVSNTDTLLRGQANGPMFVSAYRLPPVNNFSAKDDTMSPQTRDFDRIYGRMSQRTRLCNDAHENDGDDEVDNDESKRRNKAQLRDTTNFSDSEDSKLRETTDLDSLLGAVPGNPIYLDSSSSSDDGEFDISPDRCSRPRSVSENEFKLRTPRSSRRSSICRGHNSSLSLTDSSFNSDASFESEDDVDGDLSGSPYSFLADCSQNHSTSAKNLKGSSGETSQLPDDNVPSSQTKSDNAKLQVLQAPILLDDSPDEEDDGKINRCSESCISAQGSISFDNNESLPFAIEGKIISLESSSNASSSEQIVIMSDVMEPYRTVIDQHNLIIESHVIVSDPDQKVTSFSQVLPKRSIDSPFMRTSTPTNEHTSNDKHYLGSIDQINQYPFTIMPNSLKSAISAPGLIGDRVFPFSPPAANLRHSFVSSSDSDTSSSTSISLSNVPVPMRPDIIPYDNDGQCEELCGPSMTPEPILDVDKISSDYTYKPIVDTTLVFLNKAALSSITADKSSTESENSLKHQEIVETSLVRSDPSDYPSRATTAHDDVSSNQHSASPTSLSSSPQQRSDLSQCLSTQEGAIITEQLIEEEPNGSCTSSSESSEEMDSFPPPPSQSDLLIFDERDEDIFQQMQQRDKGLSREDQFINEVPQPGSPFLSTGLPQPFSSVITDDLSLEGQIRDSNSSDKSKESSIDLIDDSRVQIEWEDKNKEMNFGVEIIPRFCSLLYDKDNDECDSVDIRDKEITSKNMIITTNMKCDLETQDGTYATSLNLEDLSHIRETNIDIENSEIIEVDEGHSLCIEGIELEFALAKEVHDEDISKDQVEVLDNVIYGNDAEIKEDIVTTLKIGITEEKECALKFHATLEDDFINNEKEDNWVSDEIEAVARVIDCLDEVLEADEKSLAVETICTDMDTDESFKCRIFNVDEEEVDVEDEETLFELEVLPDDILICSIEDPIETDDIDTSVCTVLINSEVEIFTRLDDGNSYDQDNATETTEEDIETDVGERDGEVQIVEIIERNADVVETIHISLDCDDSSECDSADSNEKYIETKEMIVTEIDTELLPEIKELELEIEEMIDMILSNAIYVVSDIETSLDTLPRIEEGFDMNNKFALEEDKTENIENIVSQDNSLCSITKVLKSGEEVFEQVDDKESSETKIVNEGPDDKNDEEEQETTVLKSDYEVTLNTIRMEYKDDDIKSEETISTTLEYQEPSEVANILTEEVGQITVSNEEVSRDEEANLLRTDVLDNCEDKKVVIIEEDNEVKEEYVMKPEDKYFPEITEEMEMVLVDEDETDKQSIDDIGIGNCKDDVECNLADDEVVDEAVKKTTEEEFIVNINESDTTIRNDDYVEKYVPSEEVFDEGLDDVNHFECSLAERKEKGESNLDITLIDGEQTDTKRNNDDSDGIQTKRKEYVALKAYNHSPESEEENILEEIETILAIVKNEGIHDINDTNDEIRETKDKILDDENKIEIEEVIVPSHCSLLYDDDNQPLDDTFKNSIRENQSVILEDKEYVSEILENKEVTITGLVDKDNFLRLCDEYDDANSMINEIMSDINECDTKPNYNISSRFDEENTLESKGVDSDQMNIEINEVIIPSHTSLLYDEEKDSDQMNIEINEVIVPSHTSLLYDEERDSDRMNIEINEVIVPSHTSLLYDKEKVEDKADYSIIEDFKTVEILDETVVILEDESARVSNETKEEENSGEEVITVRLNDDNTLGDKAEDCIGSSLYHEGTFDDKVSKASEGIRIEETVATRLDSDDFDVCQESLEILEMIVPRNDSLLQSDDNLEGVERKEEREETVNENEIDILEEDLIIVEKVVSFFNIENVPDKKQNEMGIEPEEDILPRHSVLHYDNDKLTDTKKANNIAEEKTYTRLDKEDALVCKDVEIKEEGDEVEKIDIRLYEKDDERNEEVKKDNILDCKDTLESKDCETKEQEKIHEDTLESCDLETKDEEKVGTRADEEDILECKDETKEEEKIEDILECEDTLESKDTDIKEENKIGTRIDDDNVIEEKIDKKLGYEDIFECKDGETKEEVNTVEEKIGMSLNDDVAINEEKLPLQDCDCTYEDVEQECDVIRLSYDDMSSVNDPVPGSFDLGQLNCQSPEEIWDDGES